MSRMHRLVLVVSAVCAMGLHQASATAPKSAPVKLPAPSLYPTSWELKLDYRKPARVVVELPGRGVQAFWYLPYTITNQTGQERMFLPIFELVGENGKIHRSDKNIPQQVIDAIKAREGNQFIQSSIQAAGDLRLGAEEAKYGVAVWAEPMAEMGRFAILIGGLSGEYQKVKNAADEEVVLRKTLQLNYIIRGDEVYPGEDEINESFAVDHEIRRFQISDFFDFRFSIEGKSAARSGRPILLDSVVVAL